MCVCACGVVVGGFVVLSREKKDMAMIKVGTKAKVVIGIINTHFSIYPSNEALLFILSGRFIRKTASTLRLSLFSTIHMLVLWGRLVEGWPQVWSVQDASK